MSRAKVLIVDDEPSLLRTLQTMLDAMGYEIFLASDGQTALARVTEEEPDVVLLDVMMPVIDGWGVLERLTEQRNRPRVICLSAKHTQRDLIKGWRLGADEYIAKPFEVDELLLKIEEVLGRTPEEQDARRREALDELGVQDG